jgi:signal transduction histidine kinase
MTGRPHLGDASVAAFADLVHENRASILASWKRRLGSLAAFHGPSPSTHGVRLLEWLTRSLQAHDTTAETATDLPREQCFSAPRAIAELALLTETLCELTAGPASALGNETGRDAAQRVIEAAIAQSLAREHDANDRVRKRLRLATDVTLVGAWELDPSTGVVGTDTRTRALFGITDGEPVTVDALTARLHEGDRVRVREGIATTLAAGDPYIDECRAAMPGDEGYRWIAIAADAHQGVDGAAPCIIGIVHDISAVKRAQEEHVRVVEELSRAVHISEMFVGILSHDLRNPLGAILGGAQLLALDQADPKSSRILALVVSSGERMGRMIEQLLDFTRARLGEGIPLERGDVDLAQLARSVVQEGRAASADCSLRLAAHGDCTGAWDRDRLSQILSNLVGNAVQHGKSASSIDVVVDGQDSEQVTFSVRNEGIIPPDLVPVIFNPFRGTLQKRGKSKGLGLGLYVARQIALAHGGDLAVVSSAATGTCFTLSLPRNELKAPPPKQEVHHEDELSAFESMAAPASISSVTAQLFGATPLCERAPLEHSDIVEQYASMLEAALHRKAYRGGGEGLTEALRILAERLGDLGAGPREVTDVHARALRRAVRGATPTKTQALLAEGRLLALEMMGNLASYYRRRARAPAVAPGRKAR